MNKRTFLGRRSLRVLAGLAVAVLTVAGLAGGVPAASGAAETPPDTAPGRQVALVTGDRVVLGADGRVTPLAGAGRSGMPFSIQRQDGHLYVLPADAVPLVARGQIDRRLFDVSLLASGGYGTGAELPIVVQGGGAAKPRAGARALRSLPVIGASVLRVSRGDPTFWRSATGGTGALSSGISRIWLDSKVKIDLDRSVPQIGAPAAWAAGFTGDGVRVAVLDSGVDADHPDLAGRIAAMKNFTNEADTDLVGHGTHVASTIASVDATYRGVAPGASLVIGKVILADGTGDLSVLLAAMEWACAEQHAKVVNLSLGGQDDPAVDPIEEAVDRLTERYGTLFVAGAGNQGMGGVQTVASPASADAALAVGAVDRDDALADFSGRGPRVGDYAIKPDVTAPGVGIVAARSSDGWLGNPGEARMAGSGTSMSTPHVSGAAALLFGEHPDWTPAQVKAALIASAEPTAGVGAYDQGAGRVDLARAITQTVLPEQPSLSFGLASWPHTDDVPVTRPVTYRNTGSADVTLTLAVNATGPGGATANTFSLSANAVTVPAGGTATVDVIADTRGDGPDGAYTGLLVATGGNTTVRTPVAVVREVESYDVTITAVDRDGKPTSRYFGSLGGYDSGRTADQSMDESGTLHVRAPKGTYLLGAEVISGAEDAPITDQIVAPWLEVTGDRAVTLDARTAKPITVTVPRAGAELVDGVVGHVALPAGGGFFGGWTAAADFSRVGTAQLGPDAPADRFVGAQQAMFAAPGTAGDFANSPYVYNLAWFTPGKAYTGTHRVRDDQLAVVRARNLAQGAGTFAVKGSIASSTEVPEVSFPGIPLLAVELPATREELFTTGGVSWSTIFFQGDPAGVPAVSDASQQTYGRTFRAGERVAEFTNGAVFGPSVPASADPAWAVQRPSLLNFAVPLFGAAADTAGQSKVDSAHTVVKRDGATVCESQTNTCQIEGIAPPGRYRVETVANRPSFTDLSTSVSVIWEFDHDGTAALPVQVVRFAPRLDANNAAPGGRLFTVPVCVQRNPGAAAAKVTSLTVEVSYDDGSTWQTAPVLEGAVTLRHPAAGYVSLRATVTDAAGNTAEQTVLHAYRLR